MKYFFFMVLDLVFFDMIMSIMKRYNEEKNVKNRYVVLLYSFI